MNLNELDNSGTESDSGHSVDLDTQEHQGQHSSQEVTNLPSIPFDPEWVSPFTLPPLPALRKNRGPSNLLRSPDERLHQRSSSSAYYAAAWGSPYATPSPNRSPPLQRSRRRSQDLETASPLSVKNREFTPGSTGLRKSSAVSDISSPVTAASARRRASSWDRSKSLSERFNWLSESDLSGSETNIRAGKTPTKTTFLKSLKGSADKTQVPRSRPHQVQESTATITPENFNAVDDKSVTNNDKAQVVSADMEQVIDERTDAPSPNLGAEKPLPSLPPLNGMAEKTIETAPTTTSPDSPSRPRIQSVQSFQRPKKKVPWKGRTCIIALPLDEWESTGLPPLFGSDEIRKRMEKWRAEGYDVDKLMSGGPQDDSMVFGQSRSLFPDPQDMYVERKNSRLQVHIPDQGEWDAWVDYLKEEKLRALGVTPSNSEAPMSVQSPFSSTLSRVSSTYPSVAASPPVGTFSANSNPIRIASNTFSPPLGHPSGINSHGGSHVASPSISGYHGPMHAYKQSMAQPRLTSPYDYPVSHPGYFGPGTRNTPGGYGVRQFSPPTAGNLQSLGQVLSPMVPTIPSNDNGHGAPQNPTMEQIHQQQQRQRQLQQHMMQHQRQYSYLPPPPQSKSADHLPRTPVLESPQRHTPEIMHPTPRSHRHNLSAALQKGIDDAEARRDDRRPVTEDTGDKAQLESSEDKQATTVVEEEPEPELPVLKRPETLADGDDKSDIETNPSIAASPMLMDETNPFAKPFANLQQIKEALQPQSQHKPQPSISRLNVDAPVFDPQARFSSSNFSFGNQSFNPADTSGTKPLPGGSRPTFPPKNLSISKLNVEAPAFTPSFAAESTPTKTATSLQNTPAKMSTATPSKSPFTFSSPSFNVEAAEFKPGQSFSFTAGARSMSSEHQPSPTYAGSIFGNVTIDPNSRANRRAAKIVPIVRPSSATDEEVKEDDDDEGRVKAPSDRQKRARRGGDEDNDELLFASSAPFDHAEGLSSRKQELLQEVIQDVEDSPIATDNVEIEHANVDVDVHQADKEIEAVAESKLPQVEEKTAVAPEDEISRNEVDEGELSQEVESKVEEEELLTTEDAREDEHVLVPEPEPVLIPEPTTNGDAPEKAVEIMDVASPKEHEIETKALSTSNDNLQIEDKVLNDQTEQEKAALQSNHQSKFSLSALAKPFEFRPAQSFVSQTVAPKQSNTEPKNTRGLMASRFATATPEPEPEPSKPVTQDNLPPQELYEYIQPEDAHLSGVVSPQPSFGNKSIILEMPKAQIEASAESMDSIADSLRSETQLNSVPQSPSQSSRIDDPMPSYEEIDAVMKQFEDNPDLGVERDDTPVKSTPLIDMRLPPTFRSDAPSPSPRRMVANAQERADWGLGIHKLNVGNDEISDWNDEFSPRQEDKLQSQAQYLDSHVSGLVGSILDDRFVPLENTLQTIQQSLVTILNQKAVRGLRRSMSTEKKEDSDADDEDEYEDFDGFSTYRSRSPSRNQRKAEKIRAIVTDAMAVYRPPVSEQPVVDMSEIHAALNEMRMLSQQAQQALPKEQPDMRTMMEDVISNHPHFQLLKSQEDERAVQETHRVKMDVLVSALRDAEKRTEQEVVLRQQASEDLRELNRKLLEAQERAASYQQASEEAQSSVTALLREKEVHKSLQSEHANILEAKKALEDTLAEYRVTTDEYRDKIELERARNQDVIQRMRNLREELNEKAESHQGLRVKLELLRDRMSQAMHDFSAEQEDWRHKEHELIGQNKAIQAALDHEIRHREKAELELDTLDKEHKENMRFRSQHEQAQQDISRLQEQINRMGEESKEHQDNLFKSERELAHIKESTTGEVSRVTIRLQSELETARATIESLQSDSEAQTSRLQKRLDDVELDLEEQKARHDTVTSEMVDAHNHALHESNQKHEAELEEQHTAHERKLNDLRERHTRAIHNSTDDRHRLEHQMEEKLAINEDRIKHLESQVKDLEERLEISKSAARAAVEAATSKAAANLPTPASSVMASPPQRLSSASLQMLKGTDVPEKISPQALRESIMVLQDQLQNREQKIEQLESEIAAIDKDAPAKVKERDNEITLLRELLTVRVDDLDEIIATLAQPNFDREATKHAAIRLKANLQMEQQLKERAATTGGLASALPSIATLSNLAQSPRGLPLAAAAAWGNWRKARDYGYSAVSDIASNISQTPSKSNPGSPSSFLAGIMTPPSTSQRTPPPSERNPLSPPTMRPLAAVAAARKNGGGASEARPLRTYSSQARTLSSRQAEMRRDSGDNTSPENGKRQSLSQPEIPTTPLASRSSGSLDLGEDVDEDASPYNESEHDNLDSDVTSETVAI